MILTKCKFFPFRDDSLSVAVLQESKQEDTNSVDLLNMAQNQSLPSVFLSETDMIGRLFPLFRKITSCDFLFGFKQQSAL